MADQLWFMTRIREEDNWKLVKKVSRLDSRLYISQRSVTRWNNLMH